MLNEKYKNALYILKNPGTASHVFGDCETETQHIYRIVMTECVPVNELDEARLEQFLLKEQQGLMDYSQYADRDGLQYVDMEQDVEIYPCTKRGCTTFPIEGQTYVLPADDAKSMLSQLRRMGLIALITDSIQSLAQRQDGTNLQTAFPSLDEVKACVDKGLVLPAAFLEKLNEWADLGAAEVNFDFVELKEQVA
jgi:hypothetical protein